MSGIFVPKKRLQKPNFFTPLDKSKEQYASLVGAWLFNEPAGDRILNLRQNVYTNNSDPTIVFPELKEGRRTLRFNTASGATGQGFDLGDPDYLKISSQITICAGIFIEDYATADSFDGRVISKSNGSTGDNWAVTVLKSSGGSTKVRFRVNGNSLTTGNVAENQYYHIAARYKSGTREIFLNNELIVSDTLTGNINTANDVGIGTQTTTPGGRGFRGNIDYIYVFDEFLEDNYLERTYNNPWEILQQEKVFIPITSTASPSYSITGDVTKTKVSNSTTVFTTNPVISGTVTKTKVSNAVFEFNQNKLFAGASVKTKIANSLLLYNQNTIFTGASSKTKVINAILSFNQSNGIIGSITKTKIATALLAYNQNPNIAGSNTKTKIGNASFTYQEVGGYTLTGSSLKLKTSNAITVYNQNIVFNASNTKVKISVSSFNYNTHKSFVGANAKVKVSNALLQYNTAGSHSKIGNVTKTKVSTSGIQFNKHIALDGAIVKAKTIASITALNTNSIIIGAGVKTKTINSTLIYEGFVGQYAINGVATKTKIPDANFNYTFTKTITGTVAKTKVSNSSMNYVSAIFIDWNFAELTLTAENLVKRTLQ